MHINIFSGAKFRLAVDQKKENTVT